jgi:Flp pilus assembly pilin Flp
LGGEPVINNMWYLLGRLHRDESGQGLVEYMLILALVAFGAVAGMQFLAVDLNIAFSEVGSLVNAYIT